MQRVLSIIFGTAAFLFLFTHPADARRTACGSHDGLIRHLQERHGEHVTTEAFDAAGNFVEVLVSASGTWTVLLSVPGGSTCIVAAGTDWQRVAEVPAAGEQDS